MYKLLIVDDEQYIADSLFAYFAQEEDERYEAACIDGASRWQQARHVTLPGMSIIIVLLLVLNLGNVLNAGFDQIFNTYSVSIYDTGDIIDTFVYRLGLLDAQFGPSTAMGMSNTSPCRMRFLPLTLCSTV